MISLCCQQVNLRHGVPHGESRETCVAGVGTLLLELGMLSHLTHDERYFNAAYAAMLALWELRSSLDLLGNTFDGEI
jgi:hypothetical protein